MPFCYVGCLVWQKKKNKYFAAFFFSSPNLIMSYWTDTSFLALCLIFDFRFLPWSCGNQLITQSSESDLKHGLLIKGEENYDHFNCLKTLMQEAYMYSCFATLWWWTFGVLFMLCHLVMVDFLGYYSWFAILWRWTFIIGRSCHKYHFFLLLWQKFVAAQVLLQQKYFVAMIICCDKHNFDTTNILVFVATKVCLLWQKYVCCDKYLLRQNFCHDKHMFVATNICLLQQAYFCCDRFCRDKHTFLSFAWQKRYLWQLLSMIDFWGITDALQPCESGLWGIIFVLPPCDGALFGVFLAD